MKHLLNGVGVATVIAIAVPVLAQASTTFVPSPTGAVSIQMAQAAPQAPAAARPQRPARKSQSAKPRGGGSAVFGPTSGNNVANELNRMELQRLEAGAPPPPAMATPEPVSPGGARRAATPGGPKTSGGGNIPSQTGPVSSAGAASMGPKESGGGYIPAPTGPVPTPPPPPIAHPTR